MSKLIKKITAPNGGVFTGDGTNTYLIGHKDITVVDPGPNIASHLDAILKEGDNNIKRIIVTHTHKDHSPGARPLAKLSSNFTLIGSRISFILTSKVTFFPESLSIP